MLKPILVAALLIAAIAATTTPPVPGSGSSTIATIVAGHHLPHGAHAVVLMRAKKFPKTVIMVDEFMTTPEDLASSFRTLNSLKSKAAGQAHDLMAIPKVSDGKFIPHASPAKRKRMERLLADLKAGKPHPIDGLGDMKSLNVAVAAHR